MKKTVLITGGAGYIGSITAWYLHQHGYRVVIVDIKKNTPPTLHQSGIITIVGDCSNHKLLFALCTTYQVTTIIHCAAAIEVGWSTEHPLACYSHNVGVTLAVLHTMAQAQVRNLIFSSSAAVYGSQNNHNQSPSLLHETTSTTIPLSPYGWSKIMSEQMITDQCAIKKLNAVILRYFNVAGALPNVGLGENHLPETHLIPRLLHAAQTNTPFMIYGTNYATPDGSCVRDYVHVHDIARAHLHAIQYLETYPTTQPLVANVGSGIGKSVWEIINAVEQITEKKIVTHGMPQRSGDAPTLLADITTMQTELHIHPIFSDLTTIITSAHDYHTHQQTHGTLHPTSVALNKNAKLIKPL